jgi:hypothetical protein
LELDLRLKIRRKAISMSICQLASCAKSGNFTCSRCGAATYCSKDCQKSHWRLHKKLCSKITPFKNYVVKLPTTLKAALCNITFDLPPIVDEYQRNYSQDFSMLEWVYIQMGLDSTRDMMEKNLENLYKDDYSEESLLKRWQEVSPQLWDFVKTAVPGDIFRSKKYMPYQPKAAQQFRNTPLSERGVVRNGDVVVDIGFVDFGIIFDSLEQISLGAAKVCVTGFEAEPFCVAKSIVMMQMIKMPNASARSIVEVWMSSVWSEETYSSFREAVHRILKGGEVQSLHPQVHRIVEFWGEHPKQTAAEAIAHQKKAAMNSLDSIFCMKCCSISRETDRVAYLRYYLTKALYDDNSTVIGSVVMSGRNADIGVKNMCEDGMEAIPSRVFMPFDPDFQQDLGLMDRVHHYLELNMERFMRLVQYGTVSFVPEFGFVSSENRALVQRIKSMKPHLVHWSNVVDYMAPREFHQVARQISGPETIHSLHSCNWATHVYGTDVYDIGEEGRLHFFCGGLAHIENIYSLMLDGFVPRVGPHHFRSICSSILARRFIKEFF